MIGAYAIDASMVYSMNKYHEMYRAWVPLMDDEDPDDVGVQGYLKISIQVSFTCVHVLLFLAKCVVCVLFVVRTADASF